MAPFITLKLLCIIKSFWFQLTLDLFNNIKNVLPVYIIYHLSTITFLSCSYHIYINHLSSINNLCMISFLYCILLPYFVSGVYVYIWIIFTCNKKLVYWYMWAYMWRLRIISIIAVNLPFFYSLEQSHPKT